MAILSLQHIPILSSFIDLVQYCVLHELPPREICHTNHLVGMDKRIESMMKLLDIGLDDRRYVVIHGMSGIGKTTLANAIFDKLSAKFDNTCFLDDIREGLVYGSIGQSNLSGDIKERFYKRKVLIVLDDVKKWEHIEKLVGRSCWFGAGSIIIITTKYKDVLNGGALNEDEVLSFEMKTLDDEEAVDLFCWYAFRKTNPPVGFDSFSREIIVDAGGLPLTLTLIGALLYKKDENLWRGVISRIKKLRFNNEVVERLRISYDALEDDYKKIFLDIACIRSIADDKDKAIHMWEACELDPHYGLDVLSSMSLIRMMKNSIWMHNQLKYLGKKIVREESEDPSKRSRLWDHKEAIKVVMSKEGKEKLEALVIEDGRGITFSNKKFLLNNLKVLNLSSCRSLTKTPEFSENNSLERLVFSYCYELREIHGSIGKLQRLKYLDLKDCYSLGGLPDEIGCLVNLEVLHVSGFLSYNTFKLPNSIGCLKSLSDLKVYGFTISDIPDSIGGLAKLRHMKLQTWATMLPESLGDLQSLVELTLINKRECKLPNSFGRLVKLEHLHVRGGANFDELLQSLGNLQELTTLSLGEGIITKKIPDAIGKLDKLTYLFLNTMPEELRLQSSSFFIMPSAFSQPHLLEEVNIGTNHLVQELPDLPLSVQILRVSSRSLRKIANLSTLVNLYELKLIGADDYKWQREMSDSKFERIEKLTKLHKLHLGIATASTILQFDLSSLTFLNTLTLDFQPDLDSESRPLLLPPASSSRQGSSHGLKFPNLSTLKNLYQVAFRNCFIKDGLDSLGIHHMNRITIRNCSVEVIEVICLIKNLTNLHISRCELLPNLSSSKYKKLKSLSIYECKEVVEITGLGSLVSLRKLCISGCTSLERLENLSKLENLSDIHLEDCPKLRTIEVFEGLSCSRLTIVRCGSLQINIRTN